MLQPLWGIALGNTKIEGVILEHGGNARPLCRLHLPTEAGKGYPHLLRQIVKLIEVLSAETGLRPLQVGLGYPGFPDLPTGRILHAEIPELNNQPLRFNLETLLGVPVQLAPEVACFTLAETHFGVVQGSRPGTSVVFGALLDNRINGALTIDGRLWTGRQGFAGAWGHLPLEAGGALCSCGKTGCVETVISAPALENWYATRSGTKRSLTDIAARALGHVDATATATIERFSRGFETAIAGVCTVLDPDLVVLGGAMGSMEAVQAVAARAGVPVITSKVGDQSIAQGAALLTTQKG